MMNSVCSIQVSNFELFSEQTVQESACLSIQYRYDCEENNHPDHWILSAISTFASFWRNNRAYRDWRSYSFSVLIPMLEILWDTCMRAIVGHCFFSRNCCTYSSCFWHVQFPILLGVLHRKRTWLDVRAAKKAILAYRIWLLSSLLTMSYVYAVFIHFHSKSTRFSESNIIPRIATTKWSRRWDESYFRYCSVSGISVEIALNEFCQMNQLFRRKIFITL